MAERSTLTELTQIGVEGAGTPGTLVTATRKLVAASIMPAIEVDTDIFRPRGMKFPTLVDPTKEWTSASIEGRPTYDELIYLLSSNIGTGTHTALASPAHKWVFEPGVSAPDAPRTFTVEEGSSVRAMRFGYGLVTELSMTFDRDSGCELGGAMVGRRLEDGITLSVGATALDVIPILVGDVSVYMDTTAAGLGTTKLTRCRRASVTLGDRYGVVWVLDEANDSWVAHIESEPTLEFTLTLEADAQGMGPLANLRAGASRFVRLEANGPLITGAVFNRLRVDIAGKVSDVGDFGDDDGLTTLEWTFQGVADATWGKAYSVELQNLIAAL